MVRGGLRGHSRSFWLDLLIGESEYCDPIRCEFAPYNSDDEPADLVGDEE